MRYILHVAVTLSKQAANDNEIHFARGGDVKQAANDNEIHFARGGDVNQASS